MRTRAMAGLAGMLAVSAGCDALVDAGYPGEPMARLRGTAIGFDSGAAATGAAIRWNTQRGADLTAGPVQPQPLATTPPAGVAVVVVALPVADAYFGFDGEPARIAEGSLLLTRGELFVGESIDFVLVHVDGEVAAGSSTAAYLGGVLEPGYHLLDVRATAELTPAQAYFAARCDAGAEACRWPRLYRLVPTPDDLDTELLFFARRGGEAP